MIMNMIIRTAAITAATAMDSAALYRLMAWLSPSYPVGAFSYSHGLEWLVEDGSLRDVESMVSWIGDILRFGGGRNDAILFTVAHRAASAGDMEALRETCVVASAFAASRERQMEIHAQGNAFCEITCKTWKSDTLARLREMHSDAIAYPVAVGVTAADHDIELCPALEAYLHAFIANLVSAGLRLVPLGQTDGQRAMVALESLVGKIANDGMSLSLGDLGGCAFAADMAAMKHETQYTRLFRT